MILVTGATGFIGKPLVRQLIANGYPVRTLLKPSSQTPQLPMGIPIDVAVSGLTDERGLRAALRDVDAVIHLASAERHHGATNVLETDSQGTKMLATIAAELKVRKFIYLSHLGADRASYFPVLKLKGLAEDAIRKSDVPYTILRSSIVYGPEDRFTTSIAKLLAFFPFFFLPKNGEVLLQPLHIDDLIMSLMWTLQSEHFSRQVIEIGGAEFFSYKQICETIELEIGIDRRMMPMSLSVFRSWYLFLDSFFPDLFLSSYWVDMLSYNRTCSVDSISRNFGFLPARFNYSLQHLNNIDWRKQAVQSLFKKD